MKNRMALSVMVAAALAGCGLISSPPIDNPFGLEGKQSTFTLTSSAQAVGNATITATFENLTNLNLPANPTSFTYNPSVKNITFGQGCPTPIPSTIQVTLNATVQVFDTDSQGGPRTASASVTGASFTVTTSGGQASVGNISNGSMTFSNLGTLIDILKTGSANSANLTATLTTSSTPDLAGCTLTVTWGGGSGVLKF
ncbi:hypothetical protein [Allomeiothermus silvanus]|uniref:hypothetical protein n=2 Tax=Bacteria TaxID=2 RepID=UPI0023F17874|nr:hypothetical protein [Allomeiothermus silvanus]